VILELTILALAVASDLEGEETWEDRFARCDAERAKYGIEPLSARERMAWMIGVHPCAPRYIITDFYGKVLAGHARFLRILKATPRKKDGELLWKSHAVDDLERLGYVTEKRKGWDEAYRMSERLRIPFGRSSGMSNFLVRDSEYRYLDDVNGVWRKYPA